MSPTPIPQTQEYARLGIEFKEIVSPKPETPPETVVGD
jgi:hypothetical protein